MGNFYPSTAADAYQAVNATIITLEQIHTIPYQFQFTCRDVIARIKSAALNYTMETGFKYQAWINREK
jgi:2-iminoacetate synthase ThiH